MLAPCFDHLSACSMLLMQQCAGIHCWITLLCSNMLYSLRLRLGSETNECHRAERNECPRAETNECFRAETNESNTYRESVRNTKFLGWVLKQMSVIELKEMSVRELKQMSVQELKQMSVLELKQMSPKLTGNL